MRIAFVMFLLILRNAVSATTYYIDPSGSNSNNGHSGTPWKTLTYACTQVLTPGDIIHVNAGTYIENVQSNLAVGVSIEGEGNSSLIISNVSVLYAFTIALSSATQGTNGNQHVSKIKMDGNNQTAYGAIGVAGRSNVQIYDCTFSNFDVTGVLFNAATAYLNNAPTTFATGNSFYRDTMINCAKYYFGTDNSTGCLEIGGQDGILVYNNYINQSQRAEGYNGYPIKYYSEGYNKGLKIYQNTLITLVNHFPGYMFAIELWNNIGGTEIHDNIIYGTIDLVISSKGSYARAVDVYNNFIGWDNLVPLVKDGEVGIHVEYNASDMYIHNNHFNNLSLPLYFTSPPGKNQSNIYIYYNIIENVGANTSTNSKGWGINVDGGDLTSTYNNWNIFNNVIKAKTSGGTVMWGIEVPVGTTTNITIKNNIVQNFNYAPIYIGNIPTTADVIAIQSNVFYSNGNTNDPRGTGSLTNLIQLNNLKVDPLFKSSTDFHLQAGSPCISKGISSAGVTTDYEGSTLYNPPSIGAYEYLIPAVPAYQTSMVTNSSPTILELDYNLTLNAAIVPANSTFTVLVNSVSRTVNSVSLSGNKVLLVLASPIKFGDTISVAYTKPGTNPLQTTQGGIALSIGAQSVSNNLVSNLPSYKSSVVQNATPTTLELTYDSVIVSIIPAISAFTVTVNSVNRSISLVSIVGGKVDLTLSSPIVYGDVITVAYTKPVISPLQNASGGKAASFTASPVTNNLLPNIPLFSTAVIEDSTRNLLLITYDSNLSNIVPAVSAFNVMVNTVARTINSVQIIAGKVHLILSSPVTFGDIITLDYTKPGVNPLQTATGGVAGSLIAQAVTNKCLSSIPNFVSAQVANASPSIVEMTYDNILVNIVPAVSAFTVQVNATNRTISSVAILSGKVQLTLTTPVVFGDIITVSYTKPAINSLQILAGGQAVSISLKPVTNNLVTNIPVYISSVVQNATPTILEMTYDLALTNILPAVTAFVVQINAINQTINSVAIVSGKVQLTLAIPVVFGDVVTVSYTRPAINTLQTLTGGQAATISPKPVTNNCAAVIPQFISAVVDNATPTMIEMTYDLGLANITPTVTAFVVKNNSVSQTISSISIVAGKVSLILANPVLFGHNITISYTTAATNPLQTTAGGIAGSISNRVVTNNVNAINPVYLNAVIQNTKPGIIELSYDLSLTNIIPAVSSFAILVNGVNRSVTSMSIAGNKVNLALASVVVYGDIISFSYNKPATNPLQTLAGGIAASVLSQPVTNNCINPTIPNNPPLLVIKNDTNVFSGFIGEIDASGSSDPEDDSLSYIWTAPAGIAISSSSNAKIQFLAPIVTFEQNLQFQCRLKDGKDSVSSGVSINILPYKPELAEARISKVKASDFNGNDFPINILDGDPSTKWSVDGDNQDLIMNMAAPFKISHLEMAFSQGQKYESYFDIFASSDNLVWQPIFIRTSSCGFSGNMQVFDFPPSVNDQSFALIKFVGHGNLFNTWNYLSEFNIFGEVQQSTDSSSAAKKDIVIYPNPAKDYIKVSVEDPALEPDIIRLLDFPGRIVFEGKLEPGIKIVQFPANIKSGMYIVEFRSGKLNLTLNAQKLMIIR